MSKVLVDRKLLERIARDDEGAASFADFEELKRVLAQPAEAEGVEASCAICGGTGAADSGGIHPWGEAIYVDCQCTAKQGQPAGKLDTLKRAAKGACSYSEEDWFRPENLWSCMEKDDATFVSAASPFSVLALIAAHERVIAALSAVTAERDRLENELEETELRALRFFHRFSAATALGRELREALELIEKSADGEQCRQIAYDALEPFRARAA